MSKRNRRTFPGGDDTAAEARKAQKKFEQTQEQTTYYEGEKIGGVFGFFRDYGVRETIESILIAVVLALMFRAYEAEAFIIPTGSMAPTLMGQHMDVDCKMCNHSYRAGASRENSTTEIGSRGFVESTRCPICRYEMRMKRKSNPDHHSNNGDRILVNKFVYDFSTPERWDVIVFKNPNNGKQNYIKRLVGLPGDNLLIERGDIYTMDQLEGGGFGPKQITRKPAHKVQVMLQLVDDTDHVANELRLAKWPSRWNEWSNITSPTWEVTYSNQSAVESAGSFLSGEPTPSNFKLNATSEEKWLRYRHLHPFPEDWEWISNGDLPRHMRGNRPGELISDYYCYNDQEYRMESDLANQSRRQMRSAAAHWVGDLAVEGWVDINSNNGTLMLDVVEGGAHFTCKIDVATGLATLTCSDPTVTFEDESTGTPVAAPQGKTGIRGPGSYRVMLANVDDKIFLWVDNGVVEFDGSAYLRTSPVNPKYTKSDPGDAEPLGIGGKNLAMNITRLKVHRDVYYASTKDQYSISNEAKSTFSIQEIHGIFRSPAKWDQPRAKSYFQFEKDRDRPMFPLAENQFLPMGDNSPQSLDGRVWSGPKYVDRSMLIGRAMFVYWPHSLNKPIPYFPNFKRMGFIR